EVDVVRGIFGIVDGAEEGIGAAAQHDIEGAAAAMHLVEQSQAGEEAGADQLRQQNACDQLAAERMSPHNCGSGDSRRYPRPRSVAMEVSSPAPRSFLRRLEMCASITF